MHGVTRLRISSSLAEFFPAREKFSTSLLQIFFDLLY